MKTLQLGNNGEDVKNLQLLLIKKGFKVTADGDFGAKTEIAVKTFQMLENLREDGIVGDATFAALNGDSPSPAQSPQSAVHSPQPKGKVILISAGHSTIPPKDPGACGNNYVEAQEALRLRDAVAANLRAKGFEVIEDGADGISEPLTKAIALARRADVAIEIHFNAGPAGATGVEVLAKPNLRELGHRLCAAVADATGLVKRGSDGGYRPDSSGQHHRLGFCEARGAILEVAFISNPDDMKRYVRNFDRIVENVADALTG